MDNSPQNQEPVVHSKPDLSRLPDPDVVFLPNVGNIGIPREVGAVTEFKDAILMRWGVAFVACAGAWILLVGWWMMVHYLRTQPTSPNLAGLTPDQAKDALSLHKQLSDQWRDSLSFVFDLLVTKTALPIVTLLLGYLFGSRAGDRRPS
jgi:hypothetical protein